MAFIEKDLPIEKLNPVAMSEGNSKKPVYQMHKWWARRLGSVFRMIVLAAFGRQDESEADIWHRFCNGVDLGGKIVLDPFMGGGTTVVEALRLGCRVIGVDINPVAWFVTKKEIEPVDLSALDAAFSELERTAGKRIREYYQTRCPHGHDAEVMYYFWVKVADCPTCGVRTRLFPNYELSRRDHTNVVLCPRCLQIIETPSYDKETKCPDCGEAFDPRKGVSARGSFRCSGCGKVHRVLDIVNHRGAPLDVELYALEGYCPKCGRFFKRVDRDDVARWEKAKREFQHRKDSLLFPRERIPTEGRSDPRPVNHGYTHFWQLFNERQLLCLSILLEQILQIPDPNIRELMLIAFSDCLGTNNMFCKYEVGWHKVSPFFGLHAYHPIERPAENNVWGTLFGRGSFTRCFEKMRRAKVYGQKPHERLFDLRGRRYTKYVANERIEACLVREYEELTRTERAGLLRCQSSEDLSFLPDRSVDAVITDPPYFDNVQYSELADFFYVWLRIALRDVYPWFGPESSSRSDEIVKNDGLGKTFDFFNEGLCRIFRECHRVLKDDGLLIFTFHHNQLWAWEGIAQVLLSAGFYISATPVVRSEGKSGFHSGKGNIRYDCVLVCRKSPSLWTDCDWPSLKERILSDAIFWTQRTLESGMLVNEVDVFTIVMGKTIEYYTKAYAGGNWDVDRPLTLRGALQEMADLVQLVGADVRAGRADLRPVDSKVEQLALFVLESKARYEAKAAEGCN